MSHSFQNYDSHVILQELGKYNFKTSVLPKKIEKYEFLLYSNLKNTIKPG